MPETTTPPQREITYGGPRSSDAIETEYIVRDADGNPHTLRKGLPALVPEELAQRLTGDDAPKGFKFELTTTLLDELEAEVEAEKPAKPKTTAAGGGKTGG